MITYEIILESQNSKQVANFACMAKLAKWPQTFFKPFSDYGSCYSKTNLKLIWLIWNQKAAILYQGVWHLLSD